MAKLGVRWQQGPTVAGSNPIVVDIFFKYFNKHSSKNRDFLYTTIFGSALSIAEGI
jgi:hypothetical protein